MSAIHDKALEYVNAKEHLKRREDTARNAAILRTMNQESAKLKEAKLKLSAARATLVVAIAFNFYVAAKGWGIL